MIDTEPLTAALKGPKRRVRAAMREGIPSREGAAAPERSPLRGDRGRAAKLPRFTEARTVGHDGPGALALTPQTLNRLLFFRRLAELGVQLVKVSFDGREGRGDFRAGAYVPSSDHGGGRFLELSGGAAASAVTLQTGSGPRRLTVAAAAEHVARYALGAHRPAWDRNEGSFGQVDFVVAGQKVELDFNERYLTIENHKAEL